MPMVEDFGEACCTDCRPGALQVGFKNISFTRKGNAETMFRPCRQMTTIPPVRSFASAIRCDKLYTRVAVSQASLDSTQGTQSCSCM
jgi:hypothetical protein